MPNNAIVKALLSALLFGVSTPLSKILIGRTNSFLLAGLLYIGSFVGLLPVYFWREKRAMPARIDRNNLRKISGAVICGGIIGPVLLLLGLRSACASAVALWLNFEVVMTALLGWLFFQDHLDSKGWCGVAGAFLAGLLLTASEGFGAYLPALLILGACTAWALDNHLTALIDGITPVQSTLLKGLIAGGTNVAIGLLISSSLPAFSTVLAAILLGAFSYGVSIALYISSAQKLGATRSQVIFSSAPVFGMLLAPLLLSETIGPTQVTAAVILLFSIWLLIQTRHTHLHRHEAMEHIHSHSHNDLHHDHHSGPEVINHHTHLHTHPAIEHDHPHLPDLHHRHNH